MPPRKSKEYKSCEENRAADVDFQHVTQIIRDKSEADDAEQNQRCSEPQSGMRWNRNMRAPGINSQRDQNDSKEKYCADRNKFPGVTQVVRHRDEAEQSC